MKSLIFALAPLVAFGCGNGSNGNSMPDMAMAPTTLGTAPALAIACADKAADVYTLPTGLPAMDPTHRGDVFHCAVTESLTAAKVNSQLDGYVANMFGTTYMDTEPGNVTSGFWTYRVAYRTLRNTPTGGGTPVEGDSAAILVIPEKPLQGAPLVVFSHGSVGVAPKCAPSMLDLSGAIEDQDYPVSIYKLAGYGYTVIVPDYSGFSYDQPPGYFNAEDEAHSVLDATRAAANLLTAPPDKVVIVGHSQGGHSALAAESYAKAYGMKGTLIGVATFAPLWISMSLWGGAVTSAGGLMTSTDVSSILYAMEYAYSASALRGDPAGGTDVFQTAKRAAVKDTLFGGECYDKTKLMALGATPADFFDADYVNNVGFQCAAVPIGADCSMAPSTPAGDAPLWKSRWIDDRPQLDATLGVPILAWFGGMDTTVKPAWAGCVRDRIDANLSAAGATTTATYCFDSAAQHRDIIRGTAADYVNQWIAARAGIGSEPTACPDFPASTTCAPPTNDY